MSLRSIHSTLRTNDWWNNILPPIWAFYFLGKLHATNYAVNGREIIFLFLLLIGIAMFGFILGEWTDIKDDAKVGKANQLADKSVLVRLFLLGLALFFIALSSFFLYFGNVLKVLVVAQLLCFVLYSLPPFRLKRFRLFSLVLDATYSGSLMYVLVFSLTQSVVHEPIIMGIFIWGFMKGARNYLLHTLNDAQHDKQLQIASFGNTWNETKVLKVIKRLIIPIEFMALIFVFILFEVHHQKLVAIYILALIFASYHKSDSNTIGRYNFVANMNYFHEVFLLIIAVLLFSMNNLAALVFIPFFTFIFPSIWSWVVSGWQIVRRKRKMRIKN